MYFNTKIEDEKYTYYSLYNFMPLNQNNFFLSEVFKNNKNNKNIKNNTNSSLGIVPTNLAEEYSSGCYGLL